MPHTGSRTAFFFSFAFLRAFFFALLFFFFFFFFFTFYFLLFEQYELAVGILSMYYFINSLMPMGLYGNGWFVHGLRSIFRSGKRLASTRKRMSHHFW
jgi:hypothetical protein